MSEESSGFDEASRWLLSDGQILGKIRIEPRKEGGVLVSLKMPDGEDYVVAVEKMNAASASQFCELARGEYSERKASKAAKKALAAPAPERPAESTEVLQVPQTRMAVDPFDPESIRGRLGEVERYEEDLLAELAKISKEKFMLVKFMEVINASEDVTTELPDIPQEEGNSGS